MQLSNLRVFFQVHAWHGFSHCAQEHCSPTFAYDTELLGGRLCVKWVSMLYINLAHPQLRLFGETMNHHIFRECIAHEFLTCLMGILDFHPCPSLALLHRSKH